MTFSDRLTKLLSSRFLLCAGAAVPLAMAGQWHLVFATVILYVFADSLTRVVELLKTADRIIELFKGDWAVKLDAILDATVAELEKGKAGAAATGTPGLATLGK